MILASAAVTLPLASVTQAAERSVEEFRTYVARRMVNVQEEQLSAYVAKVDSNSDGKISDQEFRLRIKAFQQSFQRIAVKPQKLGHSLPDNWLTDWQAAKDKSSETGKPILAMFSASWCGPCKSMIATVFPTDEAGEALVDFVPVYVDSEKHRDLAQEYQIRAFPTFKCINPDGEIVQEHVGAKNTEGFVALLREFYTASRDLASEAANK